MTIYGAKPEKHEYFWYENWVTGQRATTKTEWQDKEEHKKIATPFVPDKEFLFT